MYLAIDSLFITFTLIIWSIPMHILILLFRAHSRSKWIVTRMDEKLLRVMMGPEGDV